MQFYLALLVVLAILPFLLHIQLFYCSAIASTVLCELVFVLLDSELRTSLEDIRHVLLCCACANCAMHIPGKISCAALEKSLVSALNDSLLSPRVISALSVEPHLHMCTESVHCAGNECVKSTGLDVPVLSFVPISYWFSASHWHCAVCQHYSNPVPAFVHSSHKSTLFCSAAVPGMASHRCSEFCTGGEIGNSSFWPPQRQKHG